MSLHQGEVRRPNPITDVGSGRVRGKDSVYLSELTKKLNDLFEGDLSEQDKLF